MSLLFMDGFDYLSATQIPSSGTAKWSALSGKTIDTANTRFGSGQCIQSAANFDYVERSTGSNLVAGVLGVAVKIVSGVNPAANIFVLHDNTTVQMGLVTNSDRTFSVYRGTISNILGTSSATYTFDQWFFVELKWKIASSVSSGDVVVALDGSNILSVAATSNTKATANAYATKYRLGGDSTNGTSTTVNRYYFDDHYFCDLSGSTNNNLLGVVRVNTLLPSGVGNSSQLTNQSGNSTNNYLQVDDPNSHDTDTTYVESSTVGNKDTYAFQDLPSTTQTVYGVAVNLVAKKTDVGARTINVVTRLGSTDTDSTATGGITSSYVNYQTIMENKPDTTTWAASDINGAEFGMKVTS